MTGTSWILPTVALAADYFVQYDQSQTCHGARVLDGDAMRIMSLEVISSVHVI